MVEHRGEQHQVDAKHTVFVSIEGESTTLTAEVGALETVAAVLEALQRTHGRQDLRDLAISAEDAEDSVASTATVNEVLRGQRRGRLHLHRCQRVTVAVEYNGRSLTHEFSPASTVHRVLTWAVSKNGFDVEGDIHDLVLQVAGTTVPLAPNVHIGTLLRDRRCDLSLQLVPKDRPQG